VHEHGIAGEDQIFFFVGQPSDAPESADGGMSLITRHQPFLTDVSKGSGRSILSNEVNFGPCRRMRILVENSPGVWRYIAKIVPYGKGDGGFAVVPAYRGRGGAVLKIRLIDTFSHLIRPRDPVVVDRRTVTNRIKLSFHPDGMTQVSAANGSSTVISGLDQNTGAFRGMGVHGAPFSRPVESGAVFGMTVWGLEHYPRTELTKDTIRISRLELGKRGLLNRAAISLEGYIIHRKHPFSATNNEGGPQVRLVHWNGTLGVREIMDLRVCNLHSEESYVGIRCFRIPKPRVDKNPSGYMLASQRDRIEHTGLNVFFPAPGRALMGKTLDRGLIAPSLIMPLGGLID
jgi:hypothetical protein